MTNKSVIIISVLLLLPLVCSANFEIQENPKNVIVFEGEHAFLQLTIKNDLMHDDYYTIDSVDYNWGLLNKLNLVNVRINSDESKTIELEFEPMKDLGKKTYGVNLIIKSLSTGEKIEKLLQITLADSDTAFSIENVDPDEVDLRKEDNKIEVTIRNNLDNDYYGLNVVLSNNLFNVNKKIDLLSKEIKTEKFILPTDSEAEGGDHDTYASFYYNDRLIGKNKFNLKVSQYEGIREIITNDDSLLVYRETTKKINSGNSVSSQKFTKKLTFVENLFTKTTPKPDIIIKQDGSKILTWEIRLEPGEEKDIVVVTNYRNPLIAFILLIGLLLLLLRYMKRDIIIDKKVFSVKKDKNTQKMKVVLTVKNKSKHLIRNVRVMETVNNVKGEPHGFGNMDPLKINRSASSINIIWKLDSLSSNEEVVLTYNVESKMHKIGRLLLPPTLARYMMNEKPVISKSNRIVISK